MELTTGGARQKQNFKKELKAGEYWKCLNKIEGNGIGKGRFAQRLSGVCMKEHIPGYIESAINVLDGYSSTYWQCNKGDYLTFALKGNPKVDEVSITFVRENNLPATFEVQLSGGGGQFLTVYSDIVEEYGKSKTYKFKGTTASDLRILLNDDRIGISEVDIVKSK